MQLEKTKTEQIQDAIVDVLASAPAAMIGGDLYRAIEIADSESIIYKALNKLQRTGDVENLGDGLSPKGQICKAYTLTELGHQRREQRQPRADVTRRFNATGAAIPLEADTAWPDALEAHHGKTSALLDTDTATDRLMSALQQSIGDPILAAIDRLPEPRWVDGPMHAQRLRWLACSSHIRREPDIEAWLNDLAGIIEGMSS